MIKHIIVSIDSFKGSLSSFQANSLIEKGILSINPKLNIENIAIGDGGERSLDAIVNAMGGDFKTIESINSKGEKSYTKIGISNNTAIIDSSDIIGMNILKEKPNAYIDSSRGLGIVIKKVLDLGFEEMIFTIGGSAISELGIGMLSELGVKFYNFENKDFIPFGVNDLSNINNIDVTEFDFRIFNTKISVLSDVQNTLCGKSGATFTYGKQKGINPEDFEKVDNEMLRVAKLIQKEFNKDNIDTPMTGAAGGLGFTFMTAFNASFSQGIEKILELLNMEEKIKNVDLVITGEGSIDKQTYFGKAPIGISKLAKKYEKYCFAVTGNNCLISENYEDAFDYIFDLANGPISLEDSIRNSEELLELQGKQIGRIVKLINK